MTTPDIRAVTDEAGARACHTLMCQLRPHLADIDAYLERWRCQTREGYRILALWHDGRPTALAGIRVQHNMIHGRFLYVDDLVTDADLRSHGHGAAIMEYLKDEARRLDCGRLVLDTALDNVHAHRFYYRSGLVAGALRFGMRIA